MTILATQHTRSSCTIREQHFFIDTLLNFLKVYASNFDFLQYYAANKQKARFLSSSS